MCSGCHQVGYRSTRILAGDEGFTYEHDIRSIRAVAVGVNVDVAVGAVVKLVPPFGGKLEAQVNGAWTDEIDGNRRIGVKLLDANGWFAE